MKKNIITLIIIIIILLTNNITYSFDHKTQSVVFLIGYIDTKINNIRTIQKKYNLKKDTNLLEKIEELNKIKTILKKNKNDKKYISNIITKLKKINIQLKDYTKIKVKNKKDEAILYSKIYKKRLKPIIDKLTTITLKIEKNIKNKDNLNDKDKKIILYLSQIKQTINTINKIEDINFNTKVDLQYYIIRLFNDIKNNFYQIKKIIF